MAKNISNIHDKFVKQLLSDKKMATAFLQAYIPDSVKELLLFESMEYVNTSYISDELATSFSDLVWRFSTVKYVKVQVNLLLEHKSMVDKHTAFQVLEYIALGYRTQLKSKSKPELIIPLVYYHGNKSGITARWKVFSTNYR